MNLKIKKITEYLFYLFVFLLPFQLKYLIFSSEYRFEELSVFLNFVIALIIVILFFSSVSTPLRINKNIYKIIFAILFFDLFLFVSLFISDNFVLSLSRYVYFIIAACLFFVAIHLKLNLKKILLIFILTVSLQSFIGVLQFFTQNDFQSKYLGASLHEASVLGVSVIELDGGRFLRSYGTLDHPSVLAFICFIAIVLIFFVYLKYDFSFYQKQLLYLALFITSLALLTSFSRSGLIALIGFLILTSSFFILNFKKTQYLDLSKKFFSLMLCFSLFFISFIIILSPFLLSRLNTSSRLESISINERTSQFKVSRGIISDNFWLGVGLNSYPYELLSRDSNLKPYQVQYVHNTFLLILSEIGIFAFINFIFILVYFFRMSFDSFYPFINISLFWGLLVFMSFDHFLWSLPFGLLLLFFVLSLHFLIYKEN